MFSVDCEKCKYFENDWYCSGCRHYERPLFDRYEPVDSDEKEALEAKDLQKAREAAVNEIIDIETTEEFRQMFELVQKYTCNSLHRPAFLAVYAEDSHLVASNTYMLVRLSCLVPELLKGKCVVSLSETQACCNNQFEFPQYEKLLTQNTKKAFLHKVERKFFDQQDQQNPYWQQLGFDNVVKLVIDGTEILVNQEYLDATESTLGGDLTICYTDSTTPIVIGGNNGQIVIAPIRFR